VDGQAAAAALDRAHGEVKTAIVMLRSSCDAHQARRLLEEAHGSLRKVLDRQDVR
jgi:N-acetylmuramic acid 6-phosphate (MurNAc-6-P) etherase